VAALPCPQTLYVVRQPALVTLLIGRNLDPLEALVDEFSADDC